MADFDDFDDDEFGDLDDADFVEAANKLENQTPRLIQTSKRPPTPKGFKNGSEFADLLEGAFNSDDILEDELEITGHTTVQRPTRSLPSNFRQGPPPAHNRQTTLFGGIAPESSQQPTSQVERVTLTNMNEPPTHHKLDLEAAKTWIYPTNMGHRDYQYNIVKKSLFTNVLAALPTGLGKTFIAAVVMLNWYRWAPDSQIVFMAPTKPLVTQQISACRNIAGIPDNMSATMTGHNKRTQRAEMWEDKRVFYVTPQTMENDLKQGICDPKRIVLLVVDEAHRATGAYAYVNVINFIRRFNQSFRVLALTATPGSKIEAIQSIIDSLGIAKCEIRSEESIDIQQYINKKSIEAIALEPSPEIKEVSELFVKCIQPTLSDLNQMKACYITNAANITTFGLLNAQKDWTSTPAARNMNWGLKGSIMAKFTLLQKLAHPFALLKDHGIRVFYKALTAVRDEASQKNSSKIRDKIFKNDNFRELIRVASDFSSDDKIQSHPKVEYLCDCLLRHLMNAQDKKEETRVMIFTSFRDSAEDLVKTLKKHEPLVKPHMFVGQADSKGGERGMNQQSQIQLLKDFKSGKFNTLVATSIGEEGLDIGEVDLIICYDSSASPIRMLQRMGRTGRKRDGAILILLSKGKEEESYKKALDNYQYIQKAIATGEKFIFRHDMSPRILPKTIVPEVDKKIVEIPKEQPEETARPGGKKRLTKVPAKKFHMPDGVETGFVKASNIGKPKGKKQTTLSMFPEETSDEYESPNEVIEEGLDVKVAEVADPSTYLITEEEKQFLLRNFAKVASDEDQVWSVPDVNKAYQSNRRPTPVRYVRHGAASTSFVNLMKKIREIENDEFFNDNYEFKYDPAHLKLLKKPAFVADPERPRPSKAKTTSKATPKVTPKVTPKASAFSRPVIDSTYTPLPSSNSSLPSFTSLKMKTTLKRTYSFSSEPLLLSKKARTSPSIELNDGCDDEVVHLDSSPPDFTSRRRHPSGSSPDVLRAVNKNVQDSEDNSEDSDESELPTFDSMLSMAKAKLTPKEPKENKVPPKKRISRGRSSGGAIEPKKAPKRNVVVDSEEDEDED